MWASVVWGPASSWMNATWSPIEPPVFDLWRSPRALVSMRKPSLAGTRFQRSTLIIRSLLADPQVEVVDIAVPPDVQYEVVQAAVSHSDHIKGILAQKPLGIDHSQAQKIVARLSKDRCYFGRESEHAPTTNRSGH